MPGTGILSGVIVGKCAAKTIARCIENGNVSARGLAQYEKQWKKVLGTRLERSRKKGVVRESMHKWRRIGKVGQFWVGIFTVVSISGNMVFFLNSLYARQYSFFGRLFAKYVWPGI